MNAGGAGQRAAGGLGATAAVVRACTPRRHRLWMTAVYLFMLAITVLFGVLGAAAGSASRIGVLHFFVAIANVSIWAGWLSRLLLLQMQAERLRAPGVGTAAGHAWMLAAGGTVLVPGALLCMLGMSASTAFGAAALGVIGGLLFALLPWPVAVVLPMLPGIVLMLAPATPSIDGPRLAAAAAVGGLLVVACVRGVLRTSDPASLPGWRRPILLQAPGGIGAWTGPASSAAPDALSRHPGWLVPLPRPRHAGPHAPQAALATLLAGPMGYVAPRAAVTQWGLLALFVAAVVLVPLRGDLVLIRNAALVGATLGLLGGGWTLALGLQRQRQRVSGELAELALLPGFGAPDVAASRLWRSIQWRLGQLMLFALAGVLFLAWLRAMPWPHVTLLIGMLAGTGAASVLMCASALVHRNLATERMFFVLLPLLVAAGGTLWVAMVGVPLAPHALAWAAVWIPLTAAYLVAARGTLRRFRARPHAFLLD